MDNNLVVKANELVLASYAMTRHEQNLLIACISQIDSRKAIEDDKSFVITVEQAKDLFYDNKSADNAYRDLQTASERLFDRKVRLDIGDGKELLTRFVQSVVFDPNHGAVTLRFATDIKPYLSQLEKNFTQYRLANVVQLTSQHAVRLYELIACWAGQGQRYKELEMDEFRHLMGLDGKYKQFGELKRYVLTPASDQINESTDFGVKISFRKVGRTYRYITLHFGRKVDAEVKKAHKAVLEKYKSARDADTPDLFHKMTEAQIGTFSRKLAALPELGSNAPMGASADQYAEQIAAHLRDPDKRKLYAAHLEKLGFKSF